MVQYNPKDWITFIFRFHKSDTFRQLIPLMILIGVYSGAICYFEIHYFKLKADYHRKVLELLDKSIPQIQEIIENSSQKPCFGTPLDEHLRVNEREISLVIETCIGWLLNNINEEGLSSLNRRNVFDNYHYEEIEVDLIVLNDFIDVSDQKEIFAKIDVEGYELEVLMGMSKFFDSKQIHSIQFEYGNCILERGKNLNDFISFINDYQNYKICDFNEDTNEYIVINNDNIKNYINNPWSNLYIIRF
jgi:hypothetical protein